MSDRAGSIPALSPFRIFLAMYMTSYVIDITENWDYPLAGVLFTAMALLLLALRMPRLPTAAFVALSAGQVLVFQFPDAANHCNLYIFFSAFLLIAMALGRNDTDEELADRIFPVARITLALVYFFAGFHKLNTAFIDANTSCATAFLYDFLRVYRLEWLPRPAAAMALVPWVIIAWEILGGLLLLFRRFQLPVLLFSWAMHAGLSMLVFFDFSSMAFAFFGAFLPAAYWRAWQDRQTVAIGPLRASRLTLYVLLTIGAGIGAGAMVLATGGTAWFDRVQGVALNAGFLILTWPIAMKLISRGGVRAWTGQPAWTARTPRWSLALPVFLFLWAAQPYLGLRTTGAFTMFSNLITEGPRSNHLLLGSNPIKVFGYQNDTVLVHSIDPRHARSKRRDLNGFLIPVVQFRKQIADWREEGLTGLEADFEYDGVRYSTKDIVLDNPWSSSERSLEMRLLGFRKVDPSFESCDCSW